jgi:hypothetical protein
MKFLPGLCCVLYQKSKYSPQYHVLGRPHCILSVRWDQISHTYLQNKEKETGEIIVLYVMIFTSFYIGDVEITYFYLNYSSFALFLCVNIIFSRVLTLPHFVGYSSYLHILLNSFFLLVIIHKNIVTAFISGLISLIVAARTIYLCF